MVQILEHKEKLEHIKKRYINEIEKYISAGYKIVIYGAGVFGMRLFRLLDSYNIKIEAIAVTNLNYNRDKMYGVQVYSLDDLASSREKYVYLLAIKPISQLVLENELNNRGILNYIKLPECADELLDDAYFRPVLEITPRIGCSVNCRFCPQDIFVSQYCSDSKNQQEMSIDDFKYYIDKTPDDCMIDFSGFVEPFLSKDGIKMVEYAYAKKRDIRLFTTLVGLTEESFKRIEDIPFKMVVLHIPDKLGYANIPITPKYLKLLEYVVSKDKNDGSTFVDMANCQTEPNPDVAAIIGKRFPISWQLVDRAGNLVGEGLHSVKEEKNNIYCTRAINMNHNVLLPNGDVVLCCMDFGMKRVLGNLKMHTYKEITQGKVLDIIKTANSKSGDILCRKCVYARSLET